eukprot:c28604_g1_i1 orf=372-2789(+)
MVPQEAMDVACAAAVMVRVHGPDPKGRKMRRHAFFHSESGDTTLSASGLLLSDRFKVCHDLEERGAPGIASMVITSASIVEPFLLNQSITQKQGSPKLIPGAEVDILMEAVGDLKYGTFQHGDQSAHWLPAKLAALVDVPLAGEALQALLDAHGGSADGSWEVGWALAPAEGSYQLRGLNTHSFPVPGMLKDIDIQEHSKNGERVALGDTAVKGGLAMATTRIAVLSLFSEWKITSGLVLAEPRRRGDFILVIGSPFGALSPLHFFNSISVGIVANCWPPASSSVSLLMADVRCLPGMEGAPIFGECGEFVGILTRPLRQRGGGAEVQLVITWDALVPALHDAGINLEASSQKHVNVPNAFSLKLLEEEDWNSTKAEANCEKVYQGTCCADGDHLPLTAVEQAIASVVLVTVGGGAWASGIILNDKGLILTNAHLLEPWRFGKTLPSHAERDLSVLERTKNAELSSSAQALMATNVNDLESKAWAYKEQLDLLGSDGQLLPSDETASSALANGLASWPALDANYRSYRRIRVRIDNLQPRAWYDAKVMYVSRGPLDVALLKLDSIPPSLKPITPEEGCPLPGSAAVVIGHGLFGPRSDLCPSISAGVVARVVKAAKSLCESDNGSVECPAMLETTAAVHPGGSGGAVVGARGSMIGLVTSNARHSGGAVIPHLNFSIPCAALRPIFNFANGDMSDLSILSVIDQPDEQLSAVWALVPPTPPRPSPSLPFLPHLPNGDKFSNGSKDRVSVARGSRFAKFVSEKGMEISFKQTRSIQKIEAPIPKRYPFGKEMPYRHIHSHPYHSRM